MRSISLFLLIAIAQFAFAQSPYPEQTLGSRPGAFSARSLGLGHTFVTNESGPASMMGNPALLANQQSLFRFDLSGDVTRVKETRAYPFYDAFNAVLAYNDYALNDHLYSKLDGGVAFRIPTKLKEVQSLVVSAASYSTYRFDYQYHEEVRNRYTEGGIQDTRLGDNRLDVSGDLRSITLGAAAKGSMPLSLGFSVSMLQGNWDYSKGVYYASPDSQNIIGHVKYRPSGTPAEFNVGAAYELNSRVTLGLRALVPAGDFKFKQDVQDDNFFKNVDSISIASGTVSTSYPKNFALGIQYRPQNEYRPLLSLEGEIHTYSDVNPDYSNTFEVRAGAEQQIVPGTPVRVGFVYYTAPDNSERATTLFTAGIGFHLQRLTGDFGLEVGKVNSNQRDLFPQTLYGVANRIDTDRVETGLFRGMITLRYEI